MTMMSAADTAPSPPTPSLSDEELVGQLAAGRPEALGPLHGRYAALVYGLAARSLDREGAEEIGQEVFLAVWRHAATFDPARGSFRAWVVQIARTRVLNELRRRGRRPRSTSPSPDTCDQLLPDPAPGPAEAAWRAHRRAAVRAAVDALPPRQREALSLAFLEDLTHDQVAAFLELPLGTTKSRIRAGVKALRSRLASLVASGLVVTGLTIAGLHEIGGTQRGHEKGALGSKEPWGQT
jgi:RNA polymerase sigma-70 factor (ECF subfamily)